MNQEEIVTKHKCPECDNFLVKLPRRQRMLDVTKLYCKNCKKGFTRWWRTGEIT